MLSMYWCLDTCSSKLVITCAWYCICNSDAMISDSERPTDQQQADRRAEVEQRAYELYIERGCGDGQDLDDWLKAERDLLGMDQELPEPSRHLTTKRGAATLA